MGSVTFSTRQEAINYAEQSPACAQATVQEGWFGGYTVSYQDSYATANDAQTVADWTNSNDSVVLVPVAGRSTCLAEDRKTGNCPSQVEGSRFVVQAQPNYSTLWNTVVSSGFTASINDVGPRN